MQKSLGRCWPGSQLEWSQPLSPGGWDPTLLVPSTHGHSRLLASEPAARYPVPSKHMERMGLDLCGWPHPKLLSVSICKHARDGPGAVSDHVCICVCGGGMSVVWGDPQVGVAQDQVIGTDATCLSHRTSGTPCAGRSPDSPQGRQVGVGGLAQR